MNIRRKSFSMDATELSAKRQVVVNVSTGDVDRAGDIVVQSGIDFKSFMAIGGTVLWNHDSSHPIARAVEMGHSNSKLCARVQFPEPGVSKKSDEIYGLIRAKIVNAASIGFQPKDFAPITGGGYKYNSVELMEFSFVSVPAAPGATIVARRVDRVQPIGRDAVSLSHRDRLLARRKEVEARAARTSRGLDEILARIKRDEWLKSEFPTVPKSFKRLEPSRQVRVKLASGMRHDDRFFSEFGFRSYSLSGGDFSSYRKSRAVLWQHKEPIAWCCKIEAGSDAIYATAQFPPLGVSKLSDDIFQRILRREVTDVSMGASVYPNRIKSGVAEYWYLREWSLCPAGTGRDKGAKVVSVGGRDADLSYSTRWESSAHFCADWREQEYKRIAAASAAMKYH